MPATNIVPTTSRNGQPHDPAELIELLKTYHDLTAAGDDSAAALAIGDLVVTLPAHQRAAVVELIGYTIGFDYE